LKYLSSLKISSTQAQQKYTFKNLSQDDRANFRRVDSEIIEELYSIYLLRDKIKAFDLWQR